LCGGQALPAKAGEYKREGAKPPLESSPLLKQSDEGINYINVFEKGIKGMSLF
jgi:hypothetical protein